MNMSSFLMILMSLCHRVGDALLALFHQPFGGGGGAADADGELLVLLHRILEGLKRIDFCGTVYHIGLRVRACTFLEERPSVAALAAADEEDNVVAAGKVADVGDAVGHLSANGVGVGEGSRGGYVCLNVLHNLPEPLQGLGGLRVESDVAGEVELGSLLGCLDDDGCAFGLAHEAEHLGVAALAEDDNLLAVLRIGYIFPFDTFLQVQHHGAGGIDQVNLVLLGQGVSGWWLAVSTQEHMGVAQLGKLLMVDGGQPLLAQAFHLATVVHDIAEAVQRASLLQLLLCLSDGACHAEAKAGTCVDLNFQPSL